MKKLPVIGQENNLTFEFKSLLDFANPIYLDNNATTQIDDDATNEIIKALEKNYANPSGIHNASKIVKHNILIARENVAGFIGCMPDEVIFTSGGTESINTVINSVIQTHYPRKKIITCVTEHGATLNRLKELEKLWSPKYDIVYLDVNQYGNFDINKLENMLSNNVQTNLLVTLMAANNETGTIHTNLDQAIQLSHKYGALFHIDAVQVAGKLSLKQYIDMGTDFLTVSGHKFHAPKGIGAIYVKSGIAFTPTIFGGSQESGKRAGTENVPGILALGAIAKKMPEASSYVKPLHEKFINMLSSKLPSIIINGGGVYGTINIGFKYVHREAMVLKLSEYGVYASVGSACANGIEVSHVLKAMCVSQEYIHGSVRFSLSKYTTEDEIIRAVEIIYRAYCEIRDISFGIMP